MAMHVVIPARYASSRLPGKPLALINGVPMIVHVAALASNTMADDVVVAVDDQRVLDVVADAGYQGVMTRADHPSGSDRVMQVADEMGWGDEDLVINIQGDEPMLPPQIVDDLFNAMVARANIEMATLAEPISNGRDFLDPNVVKVLVGDGLRQLIFLALRHLTLGNPLTMRNCLMPLFEAAWPGGILVFMVLGSRGCELLLTWVSPGWNALKSWNSCAG